MLECVASPFSRQSSQPRNWSQVSCIEHHYILFISPMPVWRTIFTTSVCAFNLDGPQDFLKLPFSFQLVHTSCILLFLGFYNLCTQFCEPWIYSLGPNHAHKFLIKIPDGLWKHLFEIPFSSVPFSRSVVCDSATPWSAARQASLSITNSRSLLKLMSIKSVMPSSHLILCRPLLLLPSIPPSIRVFSNESTLCMRWPKYWSSSFSLSPSNEHPGLFFFRMDWLDLLAVQGTLKSLL